MSANAVSEVVKVLTTPVPMSVASWTGMLAVLSRTLDHGKTRRRSSRNALIGSLKPAAVAGDAGGFRAGGAAHFADRFAQVVAYRAFPEAQFVAARAGGIDVAGLG